MSYPEKRSYRPTNINLPSKTNEYKRLWYHLNKQRKGGEKEMCSSKKSLSKKVKEPEEEPKSEEQSTQTKQAKKKPRKK